jgi:hypothetical protein
VMVGRGVRQPVVDSLAVAPRYIHRSNNSARPIQRKAGCHG